jgi:hypothetical protein
MVTLTSNGVSEYQIPTFVGTLYDVPKSNIRRLAIATLKQLLIVHTKSKLWSAEPSFSTFVST